MAKDPFDSLPDPPPFKPCHLDVAWKTHEYIHNYIRFADTKAALIIAWCSTVVSALYVAGLHHGLASLRLTLTNSSFSMTAAALAIVLLVLSLAAAAAVVVPRLPTEQRAGLIFWESIRVHANGDLFANNFARHNEAQLAHHMCVQLYTIAGIAQKKYGWVLLSLWLAVPGSLLSGLALLFK
jgi:hypothetical protein